MTDTRPIAVIKVGGSLLSRPDLAERLGTYIDSHKSERILLVVGGGAMVDVLRDLDITHGLGESRSHALCLEALEVSALLLSSLLPEARAVRNVLDVWRAWSEGAVPILAPRDILGADDLLCPRDALPHRWEVTSDSISVRIAVLFNARSLLLLKSAEGPSSPTIEASSSVGLIDQYFAMIAQTDFTIAYCNFTSWPVSVISLARGKEARRGSEAEPPRER
jgi:aspartokinase-like uncharacterized kinase